MTDRRHPIRRPLRARPAAAAIPVLAAALLTMLPVPGIGAAFAQGAPQGMPVEAAKARLEPFAETITVAGGLEAVQAIDVASEITGRLSAIEVADGARVKAGQVLFRLDDAIARTVLAEAQASIEVNRRNAERARDLARRGAGTARASDEAEAELLITQAQVQSAKVQLEKTVITAPFDGIAGFRQVDLGAYVSPGQTLTTLDDIDPIRAVFRLPERFAGSVHPGTAVTVEVEAFPGERFPARVAAIDPRLDPGGRSLAVRAEIDNADGRLKPGMFARITAVLNEIGDALIIPEQAIVPGRDGPFVYKIVDGKATPQPVTIGARRVGEVGVTKGLADGDLIITAGQIKIGPGMPVMPLPTGADPFAEPAPGAGASGSDAAAPAAAAPASGG
ncbi:efflux RND transporter periplasmic adaptor subunit [Tistrella mobilis]|uniref:Secretion protein n=1 Tax=Tistrella mobilis (strain KA081020-065) TaxID=1110502 RepID=I3TWR2_TISMK|nr:efflux RND transporter periplasmic adaptor subunit [Tistrella mobilis]AFK57200.1 secretion protein [Tistrella mobilis KA081020-065]